MSHLVKALWDELWFVNMGYTNKIWLIDWDNPIWRSHPPQTIHGIQLWDKYLTLKKDLDRLKLIVWKLVTKKKESQQTLFCIEFSFSFTAFLKILSNLSLFLQCIILLSRLWNLVNSTGLMVRISRSLYFSTVIISLLHYYYTIIPLLIVIRGLTSFVLESRWTAKRPMNI